MPYGKTGTAHLLAVGTPLYLIARVATAFPIMRSDMSAFRLQEFKDILALSRDSLIVDCQQTVNYPNGSGQDLSVTRSRETRRGEVCFSCRKPIEDVIEIGRDRLSSAIQRGSTAACRVACSVESNI
jgi:hypothetical protein